MSKTQITSCGGDIAHYIIVKGAARSGMWRVPMEACKGSRVFSNYNLCMIRGGRSVLWHTPRAREGDPNELHCA